MPSVFPVTSTFSTGRGASFFGSFWAAHHSQQKNEKAKCGAPINKKISCTFVPLLADVSMN